jgi:hypothetical protein
MSTVYVHKKPDPLSEPPKAAAARPCTDCRHAQRCSVEHLACRCLEVFTTSGRSSVAPRFPTAEVFQRLKVKDAKRQPRVIATHPYTYTR